MFASENHWKTWNTRFAGKEAFTYACPKGYRQGAVFNKLYKAHRVAWLIEMGEIPDGMIIDHANGVGSDNNISNLRLATQSQNLCNKRVQSNNATGVKGVSMHAPTKKWRAAIRANGKQKHLGLFDSAAEAQSAYLAAADECQGQFAYHKRTAP